MAAVCRSPSFALEPVTGSVPPWVRLQDSFDVVCPDCWWSFLKKANFGSLEAQRVSKGHQ